MIKHFGRLVSSCARTLSIGHRTRHLAAATPSLNANPPQHSVVDAAVRWLLIVILVFAPLFRAGQTALSLLILELVAVAILVLVLWDPERRSITRREGAFLVLLAVLPLLYLVPLPASLAGWLPGRDLYIAGLSLVQGDAEAFIPTLSIYPLETQSAWLVLLVPISVFLSVRTLDSRQAARLILLVLAVAAVQATLGLMQYGNEKGSPLYLGMTYTHFGSGVGTYANRNHLAGLLEMVLPISLALAIYSVGRRHPDTPQNLRKRISFFASMQGHTAFIYGILTLLLVVGVIFSRSRTGIALTMLGILLTVVIFSRRIGGDNVYGAAGTVVAFAVGIGAMIGLAPVLSRFSAEGALDDARWRIFSATMDGIRSFFPVGSGPGNYPDVFPAFQPLELGRWTINHAHNDYLEWLFEGGFAAALLIALFLTLYVGQWIRLRSADTWSRFRFLQIGAGIGIFLMLIHTLLDYNLHIPANIVYFSFLAGVFFTPPDGKTESAGTRRRQRRTQRLEDVENRPLAPANVTRAEPPPHQIKNPFLD